MLLRNCDVKWNSFVITSKIVLIKYFFIDFPKYTGKCKMDQNFMKIFLKDKNLL